MRINVQVPGVSVPDPDRTVSIPPQSPLPGVYTSLQPLSPSHSASLFANIAGAANAHLWTFFPQYVPTEQSVLDALVAEWIAMPGNQMYAILPTNGTGAAHGIVCMHRIVPGDRCLEIGRIIYGPALARTRAATETIFLLLRHAFDDLGYSRVEWKANALNAPSLKAAERLGFVSEGLFRYVPFPCCSVDMRDMGTNVGAENTSSARASGGIRRGSASRMMSGRL